MKNIILLLLLCNFSFLAQGQNSVIDSLSQELKKAKSNEEKSKLYVKLAIASLKADDDINFANYTLQLDSLVKNINNPRIIGASYKLSSIREHNSKNYQASINFSDKAVNQFVIAKDSIQVSKSVNSAIHSFIKLEKLNEAELFYLKYRSWITLYWNYRISMDLSRYYIAIHDFDKTSHYLEYCYTTAHEINDKQLIGKVFYRIAQLNIDLQNYDEASKNIYLAIKHLNPKKNNQLYGATYFTLGSVLDNQKLRKESIKALDSAYYYYRGKKSKPSRAKVLSRKARVYFQLRQFDLARKSIEDAISIQLELNDERALSFAYLRLGNILFHGEKKNDSAIYYMEKSLSLAKKYNIKTMIESAQYNLSNFLFEHGKYQNAYMSLKVAYKYSDSLYKADLSKKMKEVQEKFQNEKQQKELALEREEKKKLELESSRFFNYMISAIALAILIITGMFFYFRSKKLKQENITQKSLTEIQRLNNDIEKLENEKAEKEQQNSNDKKSLREKFQQHLNDYYNLTPATLEFWNHQALSGLSEEEIALKLKITKGGVGDRRKALNRKLKKKINKDFNRSSSVSLYLDEMIKFYNTEVIILKNMSTL